MELSSIVAILTIFTFLGTCWLGYNNLLLSKSVAELKLNLMTEMNGRYVRIVNFNDAKDRITRLEEQHDREKDDSK